MAWSLVVCVKGQEGLVQRVMAGEKETVPKKPSHPFWDFSALNLTQVSLKGKWFSGRCYGMAVHSLLFREVSRLTPFAPCP